MNRKQSTTDCKSYSELQTIDSPTLKSSEPTENQDRKRYNIISEELRKQIINKLTVEKKSIKEVSKEFGLKLSTCKAILQVYLKEGRIGKKTTRDRKTKIINTILIATINPLNPLQSTLTPFVQISDYKCSQKKMEETEAQQHLVSEAVQKAANHFAGVFDSNGGESQNVNIPQDSLNMLQNTFMQTQMQTLNQYLMQQSQQLEKNAFGNADDNLDNNNILGNNSILQPQQKIQEMKKEEDEKADQDVVEPPIQKKLFSENKSYIRKNSIIIQKNDDITNI